jgi:hypothetical protein
MSKERPLTSLGLQIKAHWQKYRPKMAAELERDGALDELVHAAQERTADTFYDLTVVKGLPYDMAWELVREEWAFLPSEEDDEEDSEEE